MQRSTIDVSNHFDYAVDATMETDLPPFSVFAYHINVWRLSLVDNAWNTHLRQRRILRHRGPLRGRWEACARDICSCTNDRSAQSFRLNELADPSSIHCEYSHYMPFIQFVNDNLTNISGKMESNYEG